MAAMVGRRLLAALALLSGAAALPPFSWDKLPTYVHCANQTGPLNADAARRFAKTTFVTLEKWHCKECAPKDAGAEGKMEAEGKRLKALNPRLEVVMYFAADLARTWYHDHHHHHHPTPPLPSPAPTGRYDVGVWFNAHPELELRCGGKRVSGEGFYVFDYAQPAAVERWVETFTDAVATGYIDGGFVGESSS